MKKTPNKPRSLDAPIAGQQLECVTGLRAHIITGGLDDPADSNPEAP